VDLRLRSLRRRLPMSGSGGMRQHQSHNVGTSNDEEGRVSPNYESWGSIREVPPSVVASILECLGRRTIPEVAILVAQVALFFLAREVITSGGGGLSWPQGFICVMALALMIWAPGLYYFFKGAGNRDHAENCENDQVPPPQPGDE
jgi:hypothetical protein